MVSTMKKISLIWTSVVYFSITFLICYFVLPFLMKAAPSWMVGLAAGGLVLVIRFWKFLSLD